VSTKYLFAAMKARTDNPVQKLILIYLADSANENGICWPSHSTIAENCECSIASVKRHLEELLVKGYIGIENKAVKGFKTSNRYQITEPNSIKTNGRSAIAQIEPSATIAHSELTDSSQRAIEPISNLPTKQDIYTAFKIPTFEEVEAYTLTRPTPINPEKFIDFYQSKGWMVGKNKMKDWQAAVRNWEKSSAGTKQPSNSTRHSDIYAELTDTSWAN
jgi:DNA-binding MarR family transcriptional regulator